MKEIPECIPNMTPRNAGLRPACPPRCTEPYGSVFASPRRSLRCAASPRRQLRRRDLRRTGGCCTWVSPTGFLPLRVQHLERVRPLVVQEARDAPEDAQRLDRARGLDGPQVQGL